MAQLALYLFGPPRVAVAGAERYIRRRKGVALLAYLAVTRQPHSRDALATLFWPEFDQTGARHNLRRTLSELHQTLDHKWLAIDRTTIRLRDDAEAWVDLWQFHRLLAACQQHDHAKEKVCTACLPLLQQATELYHDDFLAGFTCSFALISIACDEGELEQAEEYLKVALAQYQQQGIEGRLADVYRCLGQVMVAYGRRQAPLPPNRGRVNCWRNCHRRESMQQCNRLIYGLL